MGNSLQLAFLRLCLRSVIHISSSLSSSPMATKSQTLANLRDPPPPPPLISSYLGLSFMVFVGLLPRSAQTHISSLQSRNRILSLKLFQAEDQLRSLRSRRKEDSMANARVVEIFASHRNAWQQQEKRLREEIERKEGEVERLRAKAGELERAVKERDELLDFVGRRRRDEEEEEEFGEFCGEKDGDHQVELLNLGVVDSDSNHNNYNRFLERSSAWQDMQYDFHSLASVYDMKNFVARRESPWKVDGDSTVSSKLKLLEQELINLEKVGKGDLSKVSSLMRKQAKRYQSLTGKIDDLCRRMQVSDPCEPTLSPEFRTQQQDEFLLEANRLQHRATETRQKLISLQAESTKSYSGDELSGHAKLSTRRCLDTIGNNFKEIQRNLEIWLARIVGDIEGILSRNGEAGGRDYYLSRYPFVSR